MLYKETNISFTLQSTLIIWHIYYMIMKAPVDDWMGSCPTLTRYSSLFLFPVWLKLVWLAHPLHPRQCCPSQRRSRACPRKGGPWAERWGPLTGSPPRDGTAWSSSCHSPAFGSHTCPWREQRWEDIGGRVCGVASIVRLPVIRYKVGPQSPNVCSLTWHWRQRIFTPYMLR